MSEEVAYLVSKTRIEKLTKFRRLKDGETISVTRPSYRRGMRFGNCSVRYKIGVNVFFNKEEAVSEFKILHLQELEELRFTYENKKKQLTQNLKAVQEQFDA